jgi:hypothetical protein
MNMLQIIMEQYQKFHAPNLRKQTLNTTICFAHAYLCLKFIMRQKTTADLKFILQARTTEIFS